MHLKYATDFPIGSELRKIKVHELKSNLHLQQSLFTRSGTKAKAVTLASFKIKEVLIKRKKPFEDGELIKEAFCKAGEVLFHDFKNKSEIISSINNISLSRNTVIRRTEAMNNNLEDLLNDDLKACKFQSLQFDKSTDISDIAQLCIFLRMVFEDMTSKEELLTIIALKGQNERQDIYNSFKTLLIRQDFQYINWSITTDGAPAMVGNRIGFIALCNNDEEIPGFTSYHCIIHQQVLCSKILKSNDIMQIAFKIVNSIRSISLQRRQFRALLEETESEYGDLLHTDVWWLSWCFFF
ncbi:general transcription factor II-I repeat domain-containing protein 2A [Trichonephila clavipes]|nr:general transcription factor II-I repeat domain-containing protein 2A [Trichonephila clavipes]